MGASAVAVACALAAAAYLAWLRAEMLRPYRGWTGAGVVVQVERGWSSRAILERLEEAGVIRDAGRVAVYLRIRGDGDALKAGEYRFDEPLSPVDVLERLRRGEVLLHAITVPEGLTVEETARRFAEEGLADAEALIRALGDPTPIRSFDPQATDLEGYLFPETYHFPRGAEPRDIAQTLVRGFLEAVGERYADEARAVGLTPRQAVTLASMIEKETGMAAERARISRVFHNRIALGMRMQCDPTVIYALARDGRYRGALTSEDLRYSSPWNTYVVTGLPPGPIASAGRAALMAAVRPAPGDELYFVAAAGGGHRFSSSLAEHNRAVGAWRDYVRSSR